MALNILSIKIKVLYQSTLNQRNFTCIVGRNSMEQTACKFIDYPNRCEFNKKIFLRRCLQILFPLHCCHAPSLFPFQKHSFLGGNISLQQLCWTECKRTRAKSTGHKRTGSVRFLNNNNNSPSRSALKLNSCPTAFPEGIESMCSESG